MRRPQIHLSPLSDFFFSFCSYFKDGLKTIAHFGTYIEDLSMKLQAIRQKQDEEKKKLIELRTVLRSTPDFDRVEVKLFKLIARLRKTICCTF